MNPRSKRAEDLEVAESASDDLTQHDEGQNDNDAKEDNSKKKSELIKKQVKPTPKKKKAQPLRVLKIVLFVIVAVAIAFLATCISLRWFVFNDSSDMQGTWNIVGTSKNVPITDSEMTLDEDLTYKYSLDQVSKKITVKLGNMSGTSHYKFSLDRNELVVFDGDYDELQSFNADFLDFWKSVQEQSFSFDSAGYTDRSDLKVIRLKKVS